MNLPLPRWTKRTTFSQSGRGSNLRLNDSDNLKLSTRFVADEVKDVMKTILSVVHSSTLLTSSLYGREMNRKYFYSIFSN